MPNLFFCMFINNLYLNIDNAFLLKLWCSMKMSVKAGVEFS